MPEDAGSHYKWPCKWVNGVITSINGLKTNGVSLFFLHPYLMELWAILTTVFWAHIERSQVCLSAVFFSIHNPWQTKSLTGFSQPNQTNPGHNENESLCMGPKKSNIKQRKMNQTSTTKHQTWNHGWLLAKGFHFIMQVHFIIFLC